MRACVVSAATGRCWPLFLWRPTMMASPSCRQAAAVRARYPGPRLSARPPPPRAAKAYWCTTTKSRPTQIAWASWPTRRRQHRYSHHPRPHTGRSKTRSIRTMGRSPPSSQHPPRTCSCRITGGGSRVSASRVTCTNFTTIPSTAIRINRFVTYCILLYFHSGETYLHEIFLYLCFV